MSGRALRFARPTASKTYVLDAACGNLEDSLPAELRARNLNEVKVSRAAVHEHQVRDGSYLHTSAGAGAIFTEVLAAPLQKRAGARKIKL